MTGVVTDGAPERVVGRVECRDGWTAGRLLLAMAIEDSFTPGAREVAAALRKKAPSDEEFARALHAYIQANVKFERERSEEFESGGYTLEQRAGDCDAHFRLFYGIAAAGGLHAGLALLHHGIGSSPAHALAVVDLGRGWQWAETTVRANFGEAPNDAARRLHLTNDRTDIAKEVRIMTEKDLAPIPPGFRARNAPTQVLLDAQALQRLGYLAADAPACLLSDPTAPMLREAVLAFQMANGLVPDGLLGPTTRLHIAGALNHAGPATIDGLEYPGLAGVTTPKASAHLSDEFLLAVAAMADRFRAKGSKAAAEDWLQVWTYESGIANIQTRAKNPSTGKPYGNAGINQMGDSERRATGFQGSLEEWLALSLVDQLPYVERFYAGAIRDFASKDFGAYHDGTSIYVATFAPAHLSHAGEPDYPLYSALKTPGQYAANRGLDHGSKGYISVDDMRLALLSVARSSLFTEARDRVRALGAAPAVPGSSPNRIAGVGIVLAMLAAGGWAAWNAATT